MAAAAGRDTIYALSSGGGRAGVAVIRVSGPHAARALLRLAGEPLPAPRQACLRRIRAADGDSIDRGLVLWFPGPASATGEDVAEFHVHGGTAVIAATLAALGACPGLRLAEPGMFTRRAFDHGRLDLTRVEALADLIAAETEAQRRQAVRQMEGSLERLYEDWRGRLLRASANFEAMLDFADEDLPGDLEAAARAEIATVAAEIHRHRQAEQQGAWIRQGVQIAVVGPPNAGKSSLVNALAGRDVAIVSPQPGTTRDIIEVPLDLGGYKAIVCDTAGLRPEEDAIEAEGVRRARQRAAEADLRILICDGERWPDVALPSEGEGGVGFDAADIIVLNKGDLPHVPRGVLISGRPAHVVSARCGAGLEELVTALTAAVVAHCGDGVAALPTRARHREALAECAEALARFKAVHAAEVAAEELRVALQALGRITGRVGVEEMLDRIFGEFCIGK